MIPRGEGISAAGGPTAEQAIRAEYQRYETSQVAASVALRALTGPIPPQPQEEVVRNVVPENNPFSLKVDEKYYDESKDWQAQAECRKVDPEAFFPEKGGSVREAKKVCLSCRVRQDCLEYALNHDERFGVWGGMTERERRRLKKRAV